MSRLRVNAFSVSADGFGAGPDQGQDQPLGRGGEQLHQWFVPTRTFQRNVQRRDGGTTGIDNDFAARSFENLGAWIMGRNMFGPVRGPWPDYEWKGWWGANPPYHVPVFVLTHHARPPLEMEGGTVFHFVTGGIEAALEQARAAARGKDVRIGGGAATIRQYLHAGLLDETFFMYGEDLDWAFRIKKAGWKVYYHPQVIVKHVKRAASRRSKKAQFEFQRAMLIFYRKHYAATTPRLLHLAVLLGLLLKGGRPLWSELKKSN